MLTILYPIIKFKKFVFLLAIGRTLIPRYFRSIFEGGVTELYFHLKLAKETFQNTIVTLDCDQCTMVTHHVVKPSFSKVSEVSAPEISVHFFECNHIECDQILRVSTEIFFNKFSNHVFISIIFTIQTC